MLFADFPPLEPISISAGIFCLVIGAFFTALVWTQHPWLTRRKGTMEGMHGAVPVRTFILRLLPGALLILASVPLLVGWKWFAFWMFFGN